MSIGARIRELRTNLKMTQAELADKIGVTKGAIANYELDISVPKTEVMFKIFPALNCDANYLYQDDVRFPEKIYSIAEQVHIDKYRALDSHGKTVIDTVLDIELENLRAKEAQSEQRNHLPVALHTLPPFEKIYEEQENKVYRTDQLGEDGYEYHAAFGGGVWKEKKKDNEI